MTDIIVIRGAGSHPGRDIQEPLLSTVAAALARGQAELDDGGPHDTVSLSCRYLPAARPGLLVEVRDVSRGWYWRAKIISVSHRLGLAKAETTLQLWRPLEAI